MVGLEWIERPLSREFHLQLDTGAVCRPFFDARCRPQVVRNHFGPCRYCLLAPIPLGACFCLLAQHLTNDDTFRCTLLSVIDCLYVQCYWQLGEAPIIVIPIIIIQRHCAQLFRTNYTGTNFMIWEKFRNSVELYHVFQNELLISGYKPTISPRQ